MMAVEIRLNFAHLYSNIICHHHDLNVAMYTRNQQDYMVSKTKTLSCLKICQQYHIFIPQQGRAESPTAKQTYRP